MQKPETKPFRPYFSSGPCAKRPGYCPADLDTETLGRSHRSDIGKKALEEACSRTKEILGLPEDYLVGVVPASDTGAMEMAMWSMLGERPVDVFAWESFGEGWLKDITQQLKLENTRCFQADYGQLPELNQANPNHDVIFTWNGTTSGVKVPHAEWISDQREGLTFCDATSAVFAMEMDWKKLDVITFSWQKVLGGEGAHGMLILSPKAIQRLESYTPPWPLPKIFRLTQKGKLIEGIFKGATINTPSMLCVVDYLDALNWIESLGGVQASIQKSKDNLSILENFVRDHDFIDFLAEGEDIRSNTSVCLKLDLEADKIKKLIGLLKEENVALDIAPYRDAPPGLRIWCGATVEASDLEGLLPWIKWAFHKVQA